MKQIIKKLKSRIIKNKKTLILMFFFLTVFLFSAYTHGNSNVQIPDAELKFAESSKNNKIEGSILPASCASYPTYQSASDGIAHWAGDGSGFCNPQPLPAVCSSAVNTCTPGNLGATAEYATAYQWWCNSPGGNTLCNRNISAWVSYCTGNYPGAEYQIWQWRTVELNPTQYRWTGAYCYPPTVDIHFNP
jgi:hypothetical protein